jgi:GDPmannose 4,6-dehydratase
MEKIAYIFGISGQDGSYLANLLVKKNFKVVGFTRKKNKKNLINLVKLKIYSQIKFIEYKSFANIKKYFLKNIPDYIYYLSGESNVGNSFHKPIDTYRSNILMLTNILEYCRERNLKTNIYNSCSTDCYSHNNKKLCDEKTLFNPISPYSASKAFNFWLIKYYRENFGMNCSSGILSNHESPLRRDGFVIKKIIDYVNNFNGKKKLKLGNINIYRDWGWAPDYVKAIYKISRLKKKDDFIVATGKTTSLDYLIKKIFLKKKIPIKYLDLNIKSLVRPNEIKFIKCNPGKIKKIIGWESSKNVNQIIKKLLNNEIF